MRRYNNLFTKIVEMDNLYLAFNKAKKGKGWQDSVKIIEEDLDENLFNLRDSLIDKSFTTSNYVEKQIFEPKTRTIYKLPFYPDRIVQHALMNIVEPIWSSQFIGDSYACRIGKGIHAGSRRTMEYIRRAGVGAYCLKMDISKFYPSIDHDILYSIVERKIKCKDTLWLLKDIIYSIPGTKNVPIGNYTSQWLGNLYLNELDQILKQKYHIKYYIRYCDDFILINEDKRFLKEMAAIIEQFLEEKLQLKLSKNDLFPVKNGIDFLGYRHFPRYVLLRKSTAKRIRRRTNDLPQKLKNGEISKEQFRSSIASTKGWLKWANTYNFGQALKLNELERILVDDK